MATKTEKLRNIKLLLFVHSIFFVLRYYEEEKPGDERNGWYVAKRHWLWITMLVAGLPIIVLSKGLRGIGQNISEIFRVESHWVHSDKRHLTRKERRSIRYLLMR
jgi:hypothetical protein